MSHDVKCFELASTFLADYPALDTVPNRAQLADEIQRTIEAFILYAKERQ